MILSDGDGGLGGRAYLVSSGKRHWLPDASRLAHYGLRWPEDVQVAASSTIRALPLGAPVPIPRSVEEFAFPHRTTPWNMREIAASQLSGSGVEFGAGANPFPVPRGCDVSYVDYVEGAVLHERAYTGQEDFVPLAAVDRLDRMHSFEPESLDFVIACHVIEHTPDPIGALSAAHRSLRAGGSLVLVVPDKERTFDARRPLTPIEHLIEDHVSPQRDRDMPHYHEFYELALVIDDEASRSAVATAAHAAGGDIHYHVWDFAHFLRMIAAAAAHGFVRWDAMWCQPTLTDPDANEFYIVLRK